MSNIHHNSILENIIHDICAIYRMKIRWEPAIVHDVIGRPKIVLDQLSEGLKTLGFQAKMKKYPDLFQQLFVPNSKITPIFINDVLKFPINMSQDEKKLEHFLLQFLENA